MANPTTLTKVTSINVKACDNELYLVATTPSGTSELLHMTSGFNAPVSYTVNPANVLPEGTYMLSMIGINWGGPAAFTVVLTSSSGTTTFSGTPGGVGVVWTENVTITVT